METKVKPTNSTLELTSKLAMLIYNDIKKYGSGMACFTAKETNYDYSNVVKVNKEADRVIAVVKSLGTDEKITTITNAKSMVETFLDKDILFKDILNGKTWKVFQDSFKVEI